MARTDLSHDQSGFIRPGHSAWALGRPGRHARTRVGKCIAGCWGVILCSSLVGPGLLPRTVAAGESVDATGSSESSFLDAVAGDDIDAAIAAVAKLDQLEEPSLRTLAGVVRIARRCEQEQRRDEAAEIYHTAAAICERLVDSKLGDLPAEKAVVIWHASATSLTACGRHADALRWSTLAAASATDPATSGRTGDTLLAVAAGALDSDDKLTAGKAYRLAIEMFQKNPAQQGGSDIATARLGYAWTLVMAAIESGNQAHIEKSLVAVDSFLEHHPKHDDAASAYLLKLNCQTKLGDSNGAASTRAELFSQQPKTSAACEAVKMACAAGGEHAESLLSYLIVEHEYVLMSPVTAGNLDVLQTGLLASAKEGDPEAEAAYATSLALLDEQGKVATRTLEQLQKIGHEAAAQRIALRWVAAQDERQGNPDSLNATMQEKTGRLITGAVREAACRWAGRMGHWSMLATAAEDETGLYESQKTEAAKQLAASRGRSLHVERLFAEGLLQSGKTKQSLQLWERIVDEGGADDFATLLRLAETATEAGSVAQADIRIAAARAVAMQSERDGKSSSGVAMTNLLVANLEIRQLQFDRGRDLLEQVVRSSGAEADLRGRAQWLIGETYFMQEKYPEAIAAYRQVEAIGNSDHWTAAALVQAGKSFEQLGRTREATICYSALVSRFGDSPHAGGARRRLAAMTTDGTSSPGTIRR